jgi:hypothetical protein
VSGKCHSWISIRIRSVLETVLDNGAKVQFWYVRSIESIAPENSAGTTPGGTSTCGLPGEQTQTRIISSQIESSRNPQKSHELWQLWFLCLSVQAPQSGVAEAAAALAAALATFAGSGVSVQVGAVYITVPKLGCTSRPLLYQSRCVEFKWPVLFGPCKASQEVVRRRYRCKDRLWKRVEKNT